MLSPYSLIVLLVSISIASSSILNAHHDSYQKSHPLITKAKIVKNVYKLVSPKVYHPKFKPIIYLPKLQFEKPKVYLPKFKLEKPKVYLPKFKLEKPKKYFFIPQYSLMPKFKIGPAVKLGLAGLKIGAATVLALPMSIGAAIGAPVGAIVGAKVGAVKGALIGKAIIIKKGILLTKGTKMALKAIKKPILLLYKAKKKLVKIPGKLLAYSIGLAKKSGNQIQSIIPKPDNLNIGKFPSIPISLPIIPISSILPKGSKSLEAYYRINHPWVGKQFAKIELSSSKKKRDVTALDSKNVTQIIELVKKHKAEACVMRLVCELSVDKSKYGSEGVELVSTFTQMRKLDNESTEKYQTAYDVGKIFNLEECDRRFPCEMKMPQMVKLANTLFYN